MGNWALCIWAYVGHTCMELAAIMCLSEPPHGKNKYPKQPLLDHLIIEIRTKQDRRGLFTFTKSLWKTQLKLLRLSLWKISARDQQILVLWEVFCNCYKLNPLPIATHPLNSLKGTFAF